MNDIDNEINAWVDLGDLIMDALHKTAHAETSTNQYVYSSSDSKDVIDGLRELSQENRRKANEAQQAMWHAFYDLAPVGTAEARDNKTHQEDNDHV